MNDEVKKPDDAERDPSLLTRLWWWISEKWDAFVWRRYRRTGHYIDSLIHDSAMHALLDEMGAPRSPGKDPRCIPYSLYGRLKAWHDQLTGKRP